MASGFHNPYAGSNVDAHLMNLQQTEQQNAAMRQQAFQNQQSMGLAQQQLAQQGALAQQGMQQEQMMAQQRMNRDLAMQQMAGQQASQLSAQEARQRAAADQALMSAQKALAQEAQQFQLQLKDLDFKILEAQATGNINALQALTAQQQAIRAKSSAIATKLGALGITKGQTASQAKILLARYQRQLNDTASTLTRAQTQVTNSRDAVMTALREASVNRSRKAANILQSKMGFESTLGSGPIAQGAAYALTPNIAAELEGVEGIQYLNPNEGAGTIGGMVYAAVNPFTTRLDESVSGVKSSEVIRDIAKGELSSDLYDAFRTMGAKVNDQAAFSKGITALLDGNSEEGLKAITDSGADPYTVSLVLREYEAAMLSPTSPVSVSALRQRRNEAAANNPGGIRAKALDAALIAAERKLEMVRKGSLTASGSITSADDLKTMAETVASMVNAGDIEGLMAMGTTNPEVKELVRLLSEGRAAEMEMENLIPLQGDLADEERMLLENFELDRGLSELAGIQAARSGIAGMKR